MTLFRISGPPAEPVTLVEAKAHLRASHDSEDGLIEGLVRAAREDLERQTGLVLIDQNWRLAVDTLPASGMLTLSKHPIRSIDTVTVYGADGTPITLPAGAWEADLHSRPVRLRLDAGIAPAGRVMNGIEVDFTAGFGEAGTDVPDTLKRAILILTAHWYEFRGGFGPEDQPVSYPPGYDRLISSHRVRRL